jgi:hypothetical protein
MVYGNRNAPHPPISSIGESHSRDFMDAVVFELKPSRTERLLSRGIQAFTAILLLVAPLATVLKIGGIGALLWVGGIPNGYQRHRSRRSQGVLRVWQSANGQWGLTLNNGRSWPACLRGDTFKHPWLIVLVLQTAHRCFYIPIFRDALNDFEFRTLSTRLSFFSL